MTLDGFTKEYLMDTELNLVPSILSKEGKQKYLKMMRKNKYIDVTEYWFDDEENPDRLAWVDIEGMGYGWLFLKKPKFLWRHIIYKYAKNLIKETDDERLCMLVYDPRYKATCIFWEDKTTPCIYCVRFSNEKLHFL